MSGSHKEFPKKAVAVQLGLAALVGIGFLFADKPAAHASAEKVIKPVVAAAAKVLSPIGKVEVKQESMASAARSGEEIYTSTCGACHDNGIAGAPKLDDKASWETRLAGGFTALVASAINGKGAMPARGGNPDITDSEMELVVSHIVKKAGIELVAKSASTMAAPAATEAMAVKAEPAPKVAEAKVEIEEAAEVAEEIPDEVAAVEVTPIEATIVETKDAVVETAVAVKEAVVEKTEEVKTVATTAVASVTAAVTAVVDHSAGEAIYKSSCFACHDSGVAGSPKVGDKDAWTSRIATGNDALYASAINGKGAMPAKGGNTSIPDADVKAAVDYMTAKSM